MADYGLVKQSHPRASEQCLHPRPRAVYQAIVFTL